MASSATGMARKPPRRNLPSTSRVVIGEMA
jgi:hypothetical protein